MKLKILMNIFFAGLIFLGGAISIQAQSASKILVIQLDNDIINPVTSEYISYAIDKATKEDEQLVCTNRLGPVSPN